MQRRTVSLGLAAAAFALALAQRPGVATSDTKIDLHVDPGGFLTDVAAVWSPSGGLGQVQGGQYAGYLWPTGPFHAVGHLIGLPEWLVQRLWLGLVLALAAWGTVRLLAALVPQAGPLALAGAGALMLANPYVVLSANRTSSLLGYAALPWLLLVVHRGLRAPRGWWWPAAFALIVASTGGGVNAAVTAWVLLGPVLFAAHELVTGAVTPRAVAAFALRAALLAVPASAWWALPALVHAAYGVDFLQFTEQPGAIWGTTSLSESLRLMGFWLSYVGVGFGESLGPYSPGLPPMLFDAPVVAASLLVPGLALAGLVWTRRVPYGSFLALLTFAGLLVMFAGFPAGTPLRRALTFTYNHVDALQFLRTTHKAAPLVALGVACLFGLALAELARRLGPRPLRVALPAAAAALIALAALPLVRGEPVDQHLEWDEIPGPWRAVASDLDRELAPDRRALILPGQLYAFYDWGATIDPILPALTSRRVAVRSTPPYMDARATDVLWTVDSLVQQDRLVPGQLDQLLDLLAAGAVVTGTDDEHARSGAASPADAGRALARDGSLGQPARTYGPLRRFRAELDEPLALAQVRRYHRPQAPGVLRLERGPLTVVDGSAGTLAGMAAFGTLRPPFVYAGDASSLRGAAEVVIGDGNRRRTIAASRSRQHVGATLDTGAGFSEDAAVLDPFAGGGSDSQTVAVYSGGVSHVRAPYNPGYSQFPEHRPFAAIDGDPRTFWLADPALEADRRYVDIGFDRPRDVPHVTIVPAPDPRARVTQVEVAGRRFPIGRGPTRVPLGLRGVRGLRIRIARKISPPGRSDSAGGLAEVTIPGVAARELLRPPVLAERGLRGTDLTRTGLTYLFELTTGDQPFRRGPDGGTRLPPAHDPASAGALLERHAGDAERQIARRVHPPAERAWRADAWVSPATDAPDDALDRLAGYTGRTVFRSSGRLRGLPGARASSAFDGDASTAWLTALTPEQPVWIEWQSPREIVVEELRIVPPRRPVGVPRRVVLVSDGGREALTLDSAGRARLREPLRARRFRLEVERAGPAGPGAVGIERQAVGIAEVEFAAHEPAVIPRDGLLGARCGAISVRAGAGFLRMKPVGAVRDLDAGAPLRAEPCGRALRLPAEPVDVLSRSRVFRPHHLRLRSAASGSGRPPDATRVHTLPVRTIGRGRYEGVRLGGEGGWLVLAESFNEGWRAWCDGRELGAPIAFDGYGNAWRAPRGCRSARVAWAPQAPVDWGYLLSGGFCVALLGFLLMAAGRRRARPLPAAVPVVDDSGHRLHWTRAAAWAAAGAAAIGFVFALRAGAAAAPLLFLVLWRGVSPRALVLAGGALLAIVVPALYLVFPAEDRGGYNPEYAVDHLGAHWVAVAGVVLIALGLRRAIRPAAGAGRSRA